MKPKTLPIVYVILFALLMYGVAFVSGSMNIAPGNRVVIASVVFLFATVIILIAGYQFRQASTTVSPLTPEQSSTLVTSGIYRYSRKPMYVGFLLFLLAWAIFLGSAVTLITLPVFIWLITAIQIIPEEKVLQAKFGDVYHTYTARVRRWI